MFDAENYIKIEGSKIVDVMNGGEAGNTTRTEYANKRVNAASFWLVNKRDHASRESDCTWSDVGQGRESTKVEGTPRTRM